MKNVFFPTIGLAFLLLSSCKTRLLGERLLSEKVSSLQDGVLDVIGTPFQPGQKILIYIPGMTGNSTSKSYQDGKSEEFLLMTQNRETDWSRLWQAQGWHVTAFLWTSYSFSQSLPPVGPERLIWNWNYKDWNIAENKNKTLEEIISNPGRAPDLRTQIWDGVGVAAAKAIGRQLKELLKSSTAESSLDSSKTPEIRIVAHSLGSQIAIQVAAYLVSATFKNDPDLQGKVRLELLDPYVPDPSPWELDLWTLDRVNGNTTEFRSKIHSTLVGSLELLGNKAITPIVYGSGVSSLLSNEFKSKAIVQQMHSDWLQEKSAAAGLSSLEYGHSQTKFMYFSSISSKSPPRLNKNRQAFSAAFPTDRLKQIKAPMFINQVFGPGVSTVTLEDDEFEVAILGSAQTDNLRHLPLIDGGKTGGQSEMNCNNVYDNVSRCTTSNSSSVKAGPDSAIEEELLRLKQELKKNGGFKTVNQASAQETPKASAGGFDPQIEEDLRKLKNQVAGIADEDPQSTSSASTAGADSVISDRIERVSCTHFRRDAYSGANLQKKGSEELYLASQILKRCRGASVSAEPLKCLMGVSDPKPTLAEAKSCFRKLSQMFHPDTFERNKDWYDSTKQSKADVEEAFKAIGVAWEMISGNQNVYTVRDKGN